MCGKTPYIGKAKAMFPYSFNNYKSKHRVHRKGNQKIPQRRFHNHCLDGHLGIGDWDFILSEQCERRNQLKEKETPTYNLREHTCISTPALEYIRIRKSIFGEFFPSVLVL